MNVDALKQKRDEIQRQIQQLEQQSVELDEQILASHETERVVAGILGQINELSSVARSELLKQLLAPLTATIDLSFNPDRYRYHATLFDGDDQVVLQTADHVMPYQDLLNAVMKAVEPYQRVEMMAAIAREHLGVQLADWTVDDVNALSREMAEVTFVDYGNKETCHPRVHFSLDQGYLKVQPVGGCWERDEALLIYHAVRRRGALVKPESFMFSSERWREKSIRLARYSFVDPPKS